MMAAQYNSSLSVELIQHVPELCPYKLKKQTNQNSDEEEEE